MKTDLKYKLSLLVIFLSLIHLQIHAQVDVNSPYSHFGVGLIYNNRTATNMAMGGISFGLNSPQYINFANPASYLGFDTTSFVIEAGLFGNIVKSTTETQSAQSKNATLGYILMGFPVIKWWKSSLGVTPYSYLGYLVSDIQYIDNVGKTSFDYEGSGGLNRAYWGNAFRPVKNLSVGVNVSFIFGKLSYDKVIHFPDSAYMESFRLDNNTQVQDFLFNFGLQYSAKFKNKITLTSGLVYNATTNLNAKRDVLSYTFFQGNDQVEYVKDTIAYKSGEKGVLKIPSGFGAGIVLHDESQWLVGTEFFWQNWKKYTSYGISDSLDNSLRFSIGGQYRPFSEGIVNYWKRITYRFGFRYDKSYLKLRTNTINEFGVSFGVALPLKGTVSTINLGFEVGQGGTKNNGLIKENFFLFTMGIALYERWFIKSKFD